MTITKELVQNLRVDIDAALVDIGKKYGLTLECGGGSYSDTAMTLKVEGAPQASGDFDPKREEWKQFVRYSPPLREDDFGKQIVLDGKQYTVAGNKPRAKKNCILLSGVDGKMYNTDIKTLIRAFGRGGHESTHEADERAFETCAFLVGLKGLKFRQEFTTGGKTYRAVLIAPSAPKYPVICEDVCTGKQYKFSAEIVKPFINTVEANQ